MKCKLLMTCLAAIPLSAASIEAFTEYSPSPLNVWGNAQIPCFASIGGDVSFGHTVEYIASFKYLKVPGSGIDNYTVTPLGIRINITNRKVHPFLVTDEGIIASTKPIPYPNDTGLNFIVDFGAGLQLGRVKIGYKFQHVSNAGTLPSKNRNPGMDNNVVFFSYTIHRSKA